MNQTNNKVVMAQFPSDKEISELCKTMPKTPETKIALDLALRIQSTQTTLCTWFYRGNLTLSLLLTVAAGGLLAGQKLAANTEYILPSKMYQKAAQLEMLDLSKKAGMLALLSTFLTMRNKKILGNSQFKTDVMKKIVKTYNETFTKSSKDNNR